jgi:hypothetical protein
MWKRPLWLSIGNTKLLFTQLNLGSDIHITATTVAASWSRTVSYTSSQRTGLMERLWLERISLRGMCRAVGVTRKLAQALKARSVRDAKTGEHPQVLR